jgi:hypothetical protein
MPCDMPCIIRYPSCHAYELSRRWSSYGVKATRLVVNKIPTPHGLPGLVSYLTIFSVASMRLALFCALTTVVAAQHDPIRDFCRRHQHQTCIIDNKLYIDGGKVYYGGFVDNGSTVQQSKSAIDELTASLTSRPPIVVGKRTCH